MFILLGIVLFLIFFKVYQYFKKDLFSPCVIVCAMFCISYLCALYNYDSWGLDSYHYQTLLLIVTGLLSFVLTSIFVNDFFAVRLNNPQVSIKTLLKLTCKEFWNFFKSNHQVSLTLKSKYQSSKPKHIPLFLQICIILFPLLAIIWKINDIFKVSFLYGGPDSFSSKIDFYRGIISYSRENIVYNAPFLMNQFEKVITVLAYIIIYYLIGNLFKKDKLKNNIFLILYLIFFAIYIILTGGRMPLLKLAAASVLFCYVYSNRLHNWQKDISKQYIKIGVISLIILCGAFFLLHGIIGRNRSFTPDYYITMYAGGPLKLFDMYIEDPVEKSNIIGKETFYNINSFLYKLGIIDTKYIKHLEFRTYNGLFLGNVYTPFRRYYADFKIPGVIILPLIFALIINIFYLKMKFKIQKDEHNDLWLLLYSLIIYILFLYSIDEQFYLVGLSTTYFVMYILMILLYFVLEFSIEKGHQ